MQVNSKTKISRPAIGICLGASTISLVHIRQGQNGSSDRPPGMIIDAQTRAHEGNPRRMLVRLIEELSIDPDTSIIVTGRNLRHCVNLTSIPEPEAVESAYRFARPGDIDCSAVVSAGGETFMVYRLDTRGHISNVITGNKCASGTGEFFLQQLKRMDISIHDIDQYLDDNPFEVSGRCSVFCKSDCTHATNSGIPKSRVTSGLCRMMANKILELLKGVDKQHIMLVGGTAQNTQMVRHLEKSIRHLYIPEHAECFEAFGCALAALENHTLPYPGTHGIFKDQKTVFKSLPPLSAAEKLVSFMPGTDPSRPSGRTCLLGLDVGSTTTKAVLMAEKDCSVLASVYLRTNGDPVNASIQCYKAINDQMNPQFSPDITGIGICGSGRRIAGLHAGSKGVINEITAHARAAVYFDRDVDTLFEIGGQDAKYTLIRHSIPTDYAMNEACSAGTGSFLEESALETLGVEMTDIARQALKGKHPPNFNDQCAAFIGSDIKNAVQHGTQRRDILAGLVYSVCRNYLNRVKGARPIGKKIFMQGGVCYNPAVPLAMASLLKKPIIVPPDPGLMGAFGAALVIKQQLETGILKPKKFFLTELIKRRVKYLPSFQCRGNKDHCDRGCTISLIEIEGKKIPFGGACDKYYNQYGRESKAVSFPNRVQKRQNMVYQPPMEIGQKKTAPRCEQTVGINRSFLVNTYFPFYRTFFKKMGFTVEIPDKPDPEGIALMQAPFCYPAELSHCYFTSLLQKTVNLDYIFLPHFKAVPDIGSQSHSQLCPFAQAEPYYLGTTFSEDLKVLKTYGTRILTPVLDMTHGIGDIKKVMLQTASDMGVSAKKAGTAFKQAMDAQSNFFSQMKKLGQHFLAELEDHPDDIGIVIFGRSYNAFSPEANKGIPAKFTSRGIRVIAFDCLPIEDQEEKKGLFWGTGQQIYKGACFVKNHPRLFGVYITNFSCGPDSFILTYFRDVMGTKPSLTLELDSHTADAGLETRIEAFLDIVRLSRTRPAEPAEKTDRFLPDRILFNADQFYFKSASSGTLPLSDPDIELVIPSMGRYSSESMTAVLKGLGFNARCHKPADEACLRRGRANTLNKECLPMILITGMMLNALENRAPGKKLVFFMATASGPCRLGQYEVYLKDLIKKRQIPDAAILSLSSGASYSGFGKDFQKRIWIGTLVSDVFEDIRSMILANTRNPDAGIKLLEKQWRQVLEGLENDTIRQLMKRFEKCAAALGEITVKKPLKEVPVISLVGEIFVRRDSLSRRYLTRRLARQGFAVSCAPVSEWFFYIDRMLSLGYLKKKLSKLEKLEAVYRKNFMHKYEARIQSIFKASGLYNGSPVQIDTILKHGANYIKMDLGGEGILTVGSALENIAETACGVIAIGPFGCMPNRICESILNKTMTRREKQRLEPDNSHLSHILSTLNHLPFLAVESDGRPFPQIIEAKLETFLLRARRLHRQMTRPDHAPKNMYKKNTSTQKAHLFGSK